MQQVLKLQALAVNEVPGRAAKSRPAHIIIRALCGKPKKKTEHKSAKTQNTKHKNKQNAKTTRKGGRQKTKEKTAQRRQGCIILLIDQPFFFGLTHIR